MNRRLISVAMLIVLAATAMQAQQHEAQSATPTVRRPTAPTAEFAAPTDNTFNALSDCPTSCSGALRGIEAKSCVITFGGAEH
jgi:cytolysin (calcineurin-like family phosphatase)